MKRLLWLASAAGVGLTAHAAVASTLQVIGSDAPTASGSPTGGVTSDGNGGLIYLISGGPGPADDPHGAVLHLVPPQGGSTAWTNSIIYRFQGGNDGLYPQGNVLPDGAGGFYGTTFGGGTGASGTFYHLTPPASTGGSWTHSVLYNFAGGPNDTGGIHGDLVADSAGNIYGSAGGNTTNSVGKFKVGAVFELSPPASLGGTWTESVLATFGGPPNDGQGPLLPVLDGNGNIYLDTISGGVKNQGEVVMLTQPAGGVGQWTKTVLHDFTGGADGSYPLSLHLVNGVLYGTTAIGGANKGGTFFSLTNGPTGWTKTILYSFRATATDGYGPGGVQPMADGSFIGATGHGGANGYGTYFRLTPNGGGVTESVLYSLTGKSGGENPHGHLISDGAGGFFDNTQHGGPRNTGVVVDFIP